MEHDLILRMTKEVPDYAKVNEEIRKIIDSKDRIERSIGRKSSKISDIINKVQAKKWAETLGIEIKSLKKDKKEPSKDDYLRAILKKIEEDYVS